MSSRITSVDTARFLAIALVFYGHFVEQLMYLGSDSAGVHYKWVYSFHMPLFFLLSGVVYSERPLILRRRLVPYFAFALIPAVIALLGVPGWFPTVDLSTSAGYIDGLISTIMGLPAFSIPLWFLASLLALELLHQWLGQFWRSPSRLVIAIVGFYALGYVFNRYVDVLAHNLIFWMIHVVPLGYAFYLTGILLRRTGVLERRYPRLQMLGLLLFCVIVVTLTFDLNQGPFRLLDVVVMMFGTVGNPLLFPLTALVGSAMVILLARVLPDWRWLQHLGEITIIIYGLHGLFYHFINPPLAAWMTAHLPVGSSLGVGVFSAVVVLLSLAVAVPLALLIERYAPEMAGRRRQVLAKT